MSEMEAMIIPEIWQHTLETIRKEPGAVFLLGGVDTGKTWFMRYLVHQLVPEARVGIIDADVGQSTIGPPACISYAEFSEVPEDFGQIQPEKYAFIQSIAPGNSLLPSLLALQRIIRYAREKAPDYLILDTTGFIQGDLARQLKLAKIELLSPRYIVAFERGMELVHILSKIPRTSGIHIIRQPVAPAVQRRSREYRRAYRESLWREYFRHARVQEIPFENVVFRNFWLNDGEPLEPDEVANYAKQLDCQILYGENQRDGVFLLADGYPRKDVQYQLSRYGDMIHITSFRDIEDSILAFVDHAGFVLALGILIDIKLQEKKLIVKTALEDAGQIAWIEMSELTFNPYGPPA